MAGGDLEHVDHMARHAQRASFGIEGLDRVEQDDAAAAAQGAEQGAVPQVRRDRGHPGEVQSRGPPGAHRQPLHVVAECATRRRPRLWVCRWNRRCRSHKPRVGRAKPRTGRNRRQWAAHARQRKRPSTGHRGSPRQRFGGEDPARTAVVEHRVQPLGRQARIERNERGAGLEHGQQREHERRGSAAMHGHAGLPARGRAAPGAPRRRSTPARGPHGCRRDRPPGGHGHAGTGRPSRRSATRRRAPARPRARPGARLPARARWSRPSDVPAPRRPGRRVIGTR